MPLMKLYDVVLALCHFPALTLMVFTRSRLGLRILSIPALLSMFFLLFTGYFMLRPVRETMGVAGGVLLGNAIGSMFSSPAEAAQTPAEPPAAAPEAAAEEGGGMFDSFFGGGDEGGGGDEW